MQQTATIRQICKSDAAAFLELTQSLDAETKLMLLEPEERDWSVERQREMLEELAAKENATVFVADTGSRLVGYVSAIGGEYQRNAHKAHLVIGIINDFAGMGIGTDLMKEVEHWAKKHALHRLELTVIKHNARAVALYRKMGFVMEGNIRDSLRIDGSYVDELAMAKLLP